MQNPLTIKIPCGLAENIIWQRNLVNKYETNKVIRAVDTWLCLKSTTTSGVIQWYDKQQPQLLELCKVSRASFYGRLKYLHTKKLIAWDKKNKRINICSWQTFARHFDIDSNHFITLTYNLNDNRKIHQFLFAIEIENNQKKQCKAWHNHLIKNPELKQATEHLVMRNAAEGKRLSDAEYFRQKVWQLQQDSFKHLHTGSENSEIINAHRADNNRSVNKGLKTDWKCKSASTVSDIKKRLIEAGIITVIKVQVQSRVRARKKRHEGFVLWIQHKKQTKWLACDQIFIVPSTEPVLVKIQTAA